MGQYQQATARQLDFDSGDDRADFTPGENIEYHGPLPCASCADAILHI